MFGGGSGSGGDQGPNAPSSGGKGGSNKKEATDRFASLIDAEAPRFSKQRRENYKAWESQIQSLCSAMHKGVDSYYDRKT